MKKGAAAALVASARQLADDVDRLAFAPPVTHVYNPLRYAWEPHHRYLERYGDAPGRVVLVGMNPGPFGMARMFQSFSAAEGRPTVGVFRSLEEARAWVRNLPQKDGSR